MANGSSSTYVAVRTEKEKHQSHEFQIHQQDIENAIKHSVNGSNNVNPLSLWLGSAPMFFAVKNGKNHNNQC